MLPTWASSGPGDSGPYLGIIGTWFLSWPAGWPHLDLVTLVLTLASSVPGDSGPTWASPGPGDSDPQQHASNAPFH